MSHLDPERLAALADEAPTVAEAAHLAVCAECERERAAYQRLVALAAESRAMLGPPLTTWEPLAERLRDEGLTGAVARRGYRRATWLHRSARIAASVVLVAAGALAGRLSAGSGGSDVASRAELAPVGSAADSGTVTFRSTEEATQALTNAERVYRSAMLYLASLDSAGRGTSQSAELYRTRLAVLDAMAGAARQAVEVTPDDPMINQYYMSTLAALFRAPASS